MFFSDKCKKFLGKGEIFSSNIKNWGFLRDFLGSNFFFWWVSQVIGSFQRGMKDLFG